MIVHLVNLIGLNKNDPVTKSNEYFYKKYSRFGFYKFDKYTYEIPLWATRVKSILNSNVTVKYYINEIPNVAKEDIVIFSTMYSNVAAYAGLSHTIGTKNIYYGGVYDKRILGIYVAKVSDLYNILPRKIVNNDNLKKGKLVYDDYSIFKGKKCVPRLDLSTGCYRKCNYCIVNKNLEPINIRTIINNLTQIEDNLKFKLIYIGDKTFGDSANYLLTKDIFDDVKIVNKDFEGFIVQTHPRAITNNLVRDMYSCKVKYVELGVEDFNDSISTRLNKYNNSYSSIEAIHSLNKVGIKPIINIMVGIPNETEEQYKNNINIINEIKNSLFYINIFYYTDYNSDISYNRNETKMIKSWHDKKDEKIVKNYVKELVKINKEIINNNIK